MSVVINEENVLYGGPTAPKIYDDLNNFGDIILRKLNEYGDRVVLICALTGKQRRANELRTKSIRLAECLHYLGVRKGDGVAVCSENHLEYTTVVLATIYLGAIICPWNPGYSEAESIHVTDIFKPKVIFATNTNLKTILKIAKTRSFIEHVIPFDENLKTNLKQKLLNYPQLLDNKKIQSNPSAFRCTDVGEDETVLILVSSGTTGLPKGVEISHSNLKSCMENVFLAAQKSAALLPEVRPFNIMPWFHSYGLLSKIGAIIVGRTFITQLKYDEKTFLEAFAKYKVNILYAVPPMLVFLSKSPKVAAYDLSSIQIIFSGAATLKKETVDDLIKRFNVKMVMQSYGMSETTQGVLLQRDACMTAGSVGSLNPGLWGKVVDIETGRNLGAYEEGELCFKGVCIMKGYRNNAKETHQAIDKNGWLHTGDVGYYDEKGEWFIVDRIKELIKFKAYQVPPAEVEAILLTHPKIADVAVIGKPDEMAGELPIAFVVKHANQQLSEKEVVDFVASKTSYAKRLHGGVRFVDVIPKTATGKILRRVLKQQLINIKSKL